MFDFLTLNFFFCKKHLRFHVFCNVQMWLLLKKWITMSKKHLAFCDSSVGVKVCQILNRGNLYEISNIQVFKNDCPQGSWVQNFRVAPRPTQPFIFARSIKWVPGTPRDWVVKSKLSPRSGLVTFRQFNPIHKKGP